MENATFKHLLSPLAISLNSGQLANGQTGSRQLEIRNRVLVSAHVPGFAENNQAGDQYIAYHRRYAAEGVGLQITGGTPVHESGLLSLRADALWNLNEQVIPGYQNLSAAIHAEGGRMLAQLAHSGGTVQIDKPGVTAWSASPVRSAITGHVSHQMTIDEIDVVVQAFAAAANRVHEGGLDGVEILAAFGFLPQAFLSPLTNFREDQYGGSLKNRMRFLVQVLTAVRAQLGSDQLLGVRLPGDEYEPGGLTLDDMTVVCKHLSDNRLIDYLNITAHTNFTHTGRSKHWAPTPTPHGVFVDLAAAIKQKVSVPVFTVGRVVDPTHAERIIERGQADMVGMTRAHICDPTIVSKIVNAKQSQIRPCVGANTCIANRYSGKTISCMHNPELKAPGSVLQPALPVKNIAVVGGGPAGLEAARLCAQRGHQVTLYEKSMRVGGQLLYWAGVKSMTELNRIIEWRISELKRLGVPVKLNRTIDPAQLNQLGAQAVIVAAGAVDKPRTLPGDGTIPVVTPIQLLDKNEIGAKNVIVISDGRGQAGLVCTEWLLDKGAHVEIVTEDTAVANDLDPTNRNAWYERLGKRGVIFTAQSVVERIANNTIDLRHIYSRQLQQRDQIDLIVDWNGCQSLDSFNSSALRQSLQVPVFSIGDCVAPRNVEVAMAESLDIANMI